MQLSFEGFVAACVVTGVEVSAELCAVVVVEAVVVVAAAEIDVVVGAIAVAVIVGEEFVVDAVVDVTGGGEFDDADADVARDSDPKMLYDESDCVYSHLNVRPIVEVGY